MMDEVDTSVALAARLAHLQARIRDARITEAEITAFHKVASLMEDSSGRIHGDDLIAASFLAAPQTC